MKLGLLACRRSFATAALVVLTILIPPQNRAWAENIVADLTSHHVAVEFDFSGANITLFGAVVGQPKGDIADRDIVIVVQGPKNSVRVRRKEKAAGIWVNRESQILDNLPTFYAVVSNRSTELFTDASLRKLLGLDVNEVPLSTFASDAYPAETFTDFAEAFVRLKRQKKHYIAVPNGVKFIGDHLFRAELRLPADVQTGAYTAKVNLIRSGKLIGQYETRFDIQKTGLEGLVSQTAREQPLLYGLLSVLLAVAAGLGAAYIFRGPQGQG